MTGGASWRRAFCISRTILGGPEISDLAGPPGGDVACHGAQSFPLRRASQSGMDVTLVLTHRCNLDCHYCYAGEHHRRDMDRETLGRAVDLLWSDGADVAQLSFFGGEPFLAFEHLCDAVLRARERAARL